MRSRCASLLVSLRAAVALALLVSRSAWSAEGELEPRPVVLVSASAPLDAARLGDALRVYLDAPGWLVEVDEETLPDPSPWMESAGRRAAAVRAVAVVRVENAGQRLVLNILDRATDKTLVARLDRPPRDADLYRALALKTQALLRVTLAEEPTTGETAALLARLPQPPSARQPGDHAERTGLVVGWQERPFFRGGAHGGAPSLHGPAVGIWWLLGHRLWGGAEVDALLPVRALVDDFSLVAVRVPVVLRGGWSWPGPSWDGRAALLVEGAYVDVASSSSGMTMRELRGVAFAVGAEGEVTRRLGASWGLFGRFGFLQNLRGIETTVHGKAALDMSGWSVLATVGVILPR